ncbi:MAG TPA: zinc dependent phospholipase C family protein [Terriglobales bacterium]|nr:zinc dependent phospholipase C family protein [Terriglobales bacterium]
MCDEDLSQRHWLRTVSILLFFVCALSAPLCVSYSVLTHEEVVDLLWEHPIRDLLLQRFPDATPENLRRAHAYAYGGCLIQDMGYYPFGNRQFSDLVHYVRSGDFVEALITESADLNEYAFALGALAHYASDVSGHPAINHAVSLRFPKLRKKYGESVTFAQDPKAHIRTEFGFDVTQVAKNRFASDAYHDFIGFEVSKPLLERAFKKNYGLELSDMFNDVDLAIGTYRRAISSVIPEMTRVALLIKPADAVVETPGRNKKRFLYHISRAQYAKEWGRKFRTPGPGARILAFIFRLIPKIGPFKAMEFELPNTQTEDLFLKSINDTLDNYRLLMAGMKAGKTKLVNRDFDTGNETKAGEYKLTDDTYSTLLDRIAAKKFTSVSPELRDNILSFYQDLHAPVSTKRRADRWNNTLRELHQLQEVKEAVTTVPSPSN